MPDVEAVRKSEKVNVVTGNKTGQQVPKCSRTDLEVDSVSLFNHTHDAMGLIYTGEIAFIFFNQRFSKKELTVFLVES